MSTPNGNLSDVLTEAVNAIQNQNGHSVNQSNNVNESTESISDDHKWRNILSFWMLGLCNNYGFVVMLSAAFDIIKRFDGVSDNHYTDPLALTVSRECIVSSTGVLLLADIIPSLIVNLIAPFVPFYINLRMTLACLLSAAGYVAVAFAQHEWHAFLGVIFTSFSSGLGETSLLAYTVKFNRNVISAWASGTGAAGVAGALTYAALIYIGFTPKATLLLMLIVPLMQLISFAIILKEPCGIGIISSNTSSTTSLINHTSIDDITTISLPPLTLKQKIKYSPKVLKYVLPLFAVYISEYFINQGLLDVIFFPNIWLDHAAQYRWLQVTYQFGVFVSRSSLSCFEINQIWLMSGLQLINAIYFTIQAIFMSVPTIYIIFMIVFWEGLLGGFCYVNTYNRITKEVPMRYRSFGMGLTTIGQTLGIIAAGLLAIPIHDMICKMPAPSVLV